MLIVSAWAHLCVLECVCVHKLAYKWAKSCQCRGVVKNNQIAKPGTSSSISFCAMLMSLAYIRSHCHILLMRITWIRFLNELQCHDDCGNVIFVLEQKCKIRIDWLRMCKYIFTYRFYYSIQPSVYRKIHVFCQEFGSSADSPNIRKTHISWQDQRLVFLLFGCMFVLLWQYGNKKSSCLK